MNAPTTPTGAPLLRVVRGHPDPEELAALTAVLVAAAAATTPEPPPPAPAPRWARPDRATGFRGPRSWRTGPAGDHPPG
ncbi:hypothetical protein UO65_1697 [Actinokineospora spheciospongiae]|uniref:Acyl-CoA carboxylase subunit epsilon n=1 Tax=Actinokineospora spheciospongiae TaxID=909613 RepID=W7J1R1_9PSEU|nr:acyl-CoA carboxylase epsilon subunit [Actinokineospora spheciospongiae]EWC62987.1 hypothetical protein UO65_1697 [Actinokineospora spheciospongiae]